MRPTGQLCKMWEKIRADLRLLSAQEDEPSISRRSQIFEADDIVKQLLEI